MGGEGRRPQERFCLGATRSMNMALTSNCIILLESLLRLPKDWCQSGPVGTSQNLCERCRYLHPNPCVTDSVISGGG